MAFVVQRTGVSFTAKKIRIKTNKEVITIKRLRINSLKNVLCALTIGFAMSVSGLGSLTIHAEETATASPTASTSSGTEFVETWHDSIHSRIPSKSEASASATPSTAPTSEDTEEPSTEPSTPAFEDIEEPDFWEDPTTDDGSGGTGGEWDDTEWDDTDWDDAWPEDESTENAVDPAVTDENWSDPWEPIPEEETGDFYPADWGENGDTYEPDYGQEENYGGAGSSEYVPPALDMESAITVETTTGTYYLNARGNNLYYVYDESGNPLGYINSDTQPTAEQLENLNDILIPFGKSNPETGDFSKIIIPATVILLGAGFFVYSFYIKKLKMSK